MARRLVAFRLPESVAIEIKELARVEGISQGDFVTNALALYKTFVLYKKETQDKEKQGESLNVIQKLGEFCE